MQVTDQRDQSSLVGGDDQQRCVGSALRHYQAQRAVPIQITFFHQPAHPEGVVVQTTDGGIQVRDGGHALRLLHAKAEDRDVTYTVGAQGSMRARYVDPDTGNVTINNVYAE